jgi:uncharacterized repeat protein (TIGR01451 family)
MIVAVAMALPFYSVQSSSIARSSPAMQNALSATARSSIFSPALLAAKRDSELNIASSVRAGIFTPTAALPFQAQGTESLATFAGDCTTPKFSWSLGETVCVKVANAPVSSGVVVRRVQLGGPEGLVRQTFDVVGSSQTFSFVLPANPTSSVAGLAVDNRGTWSVALVDEDAGARDVAAIVVHDPAQAVADLQISKSLASGGFTAGSNVTYLVFITNQGPDAATNVHFADNTLSNTTFVSFAQNTGPAFNCTSPSGGSAGTTNCSATTMAANTTASFTAVYLVSAGVADGAPESDIAVIGSNTVDQFPASNNTPTTAEASNPTPPSCSITCPSNVTKAADTVNSEGQLGSIVTFGDAESTGSCGTGSVTSIPASGSFFAIGSSVVTTSTPSGQSCSFTVTVTDTTAPVISCPQPITVEESSAGSGSATVNYDVSATDNSGIVHISCDKPSGSSFNVGTTQVQCTATDDANNNANCSFSVTVTSNTVACTLSAPTSPIVVNSPANACGANVGFSVDSTGTCGTIACNHASGSFFGLGDTLVTCKSETGGASTSFTVTVNDVTAPTPNLAALPTVSGQCSVSVEPPTATDNCGGVIAANTNDPRTYDAPGTYVVHWTYGDNSGNSTSQNQTVIVDADSSAPIPDVATLPTVTGECSATVAGTPTATDNCSGSDIAGTTTDSLSFAGAGTYTVHWTYTDASGNSSHQNQTVVVTDSVAPTIALVGSGSETVECHTSFTDQGVTTTDNCVPKNVTVATSGSVDPNTPGTYTLTYTATDGGGNHASVQRTVTVVDTTPPSFTFVPANISVNTGPNAATCDTTVNPGSATASDSCGTVTVTRSPSGNTFPVGNTTVTWTATDSAGHSTTATQTVTVVDNTPPALSCPANLTVSLPLNSTATTRAVSYPAATATDNCGGAVTIGYSVASGSVFPVGTTPVTVTATDSHGNSTSCTFAVTVLYNFTGFFSPVGNLPTLNAVNAGRAIPVKFSLSGDKGLNIFAVDSPYSLSLNCATSDPGVDVTETLTAGGSSLSFGGDQYNYVWKTESSWAGTCRQLVVKLSDGSTHVANFKFK